MNIYLATDVDYKFFHEMFEKYGEVQLLPKKYKNAKDVDLLIFPGGEDVHPSRYGSTVDDGGYDEKRDEREFEIVESILNGTFKVKKVLGVCRGLQMLNVALGGTLVSDIREMYGHDHKTVHRLNWQVGFGKKSDFAEYLTVVNSLHHQCVDAPGTAMQYKVLANEAETTGSIEAMVWKDWIFGVQFHPEYLVHRDVCKIRDRFASDIIDWIKDDFSVLRMTKVSKVEEKPVVKKYRLTDEELAEKKKLYQEALAKLSEEVKTVTINTAGWYKTNEEMEKEMKSFWTTGDDNDNTQW